MKVAANWLAFQYGGDIEYISMPAWLPTRFSSHGAKEPEARQEKYAAI